MSLKQKLDETINKWALLNSRFYNAWNAGELPKSALVQYAAEYGSFIRLLPKGWETLNDAETVEEEHEHAELWDVFAKALDTEVTAPTTPEVASLMDAADKLFASPITAMGAMYVTPHPPRRRQTRRRPQGRPRGTGAPRGATGQDRPCSRRP